MGCGVQCCLPEGCVRFTFSQLPMTTSSLFLSARLYVRVSALHPRRESRIPSEITPHFSPPPPFISSDFSVVSPAVLPPLLSPVAVLTQVRQEELHGADGK